MAAVPGDIETDQQPPMTVPLRHFLVSFAFLAAGVLVGLAVALDYLVGFATLAHVHLLLAGWICITIMGAMTQFVPVWSGTSLHSRLLAGAQLPLVAIGLMGFAAGLVVNSLVWLIPFGALLLVGFWTFVYNIGRTMASIESFDVTERHFLFALGCFVLLTLLGFLLAVGFTRPMFTQVPVSRGNVVAMHATIAVFGAVLTTVYGALYQLGTMFTQTELHGIDEILRPIEEGSHPLGVVLLAVGRLLEVGVLAQIGGLLMLGAALAFSTILARKLFEMQVPWTPMHSRYAVVALGLAGWAILTVPVWLREPTGRETLFGAPGASHLLFLGTVGFVVFGTIYHIIPFIIWVHRYSDLLGYEPVPMIDDLYDDRLAAIDASVLVAGTALLVVSDWFHLPVTFQSAGGGLVGLGVVIFGTNMVLVIRRHSPHSITRIIVGSLDPRPDTTTPADTPTEK